MKKRPRRRITVTSSLNEIFVDQVEIGWCRWGEAILRPFPPLSTAFFWTILKGTV
jgi:hypothetical protein